MRLTRSLSIRNWLAIFFLPLATFIILKAIFPPSEPAFDKANLPDDAYLFTMDGYVVGKGWGRIWVAEEPVTIGERLTFFVTGKGETTRVLVSRHVEAPNHKLFSHVRVNDPVRVYGDYLRESNPPMISAYHVEKRLTAEKE